ncbi:eukaryotic translation initiation factor 3 subunit A-like [Oncorhynchus nerka]|uniref:eukaryotic translation initiation factor 3 subunit A-like n=1 Tax=Oncorhynchus nerka TaxID=8023 RepID=UPI0031B89F2E
MYPMDPERRSHQREYGEPERRSQRREYEEPETCSQRREYEEPERCSQRREYGEPERCSQRREYGEPERRSQRREYREPSSGQWDDGLETRGNGQAIARDLYSEYSSMRRTREDWEDYGASSDMSYIMDPSSRDWSEGSLRGSGAPFSPDTDGDVDGDPVELLRNRMELEIIEEQIALKKAVLAMELVGPESKAICKQKTKDKDLEVLTTNVSNNDVTLKERVNCILRKRAWTNECRSKEAANQKVPPKLVLHPPKVVKSFVERMNESILHKDSRLKGSLTLDVHEEEHPLKLKVEALLAQRHNPTVNKEDKAAKGFQHFLDVLNKGVDIDRLSKIVNNFKDLPSEEREKDKEESACSSKCHSITLLSDSSNSSPPCHRWTAKYKRSSTRDQDRDRDRGRSERNRDRRSSTRDQDRERDRDRGRSERDRDRRSSTRDQDRERDRDRGRSERDRGRSERDRDRGRSARDRRSSTRDQDRERDRDRGRSERDRDSGRSERYRDRRSSTRDQDRERYRDRRSSTRDQDRERDGGRSERDKDRERWWERDKEWDGDKESFRGLYPYSNDPTHPPASLMATDPVQYSQYMANHGSPYASAFPPGCSFPPGTVFPSTMPPSTVLPGTVPLPNPLGYPLYPNCPPSYYSGPSERFFQPYTQATGNPQFTNMDVQVQDPYASLSIPEQEIETVWPRLVHPSINQDSKPAGLNRLSIKAQLKRERYRINLINCRNIQELRQLKETPLVAAKEPGTKKVPDGDAVIEGEKLHFVVPPVATTYSGGPCRTGFPNRKGRKGKTLEEKGGLFNQGLSMRNRAYFTRWKLRLAEAVAKGLEVPSEPEPKTAPEAKDKSLTEWQRLFADSVVNVAATDLSALSEPEAEKKPDWETEQKRTDEEMKVKLKKKLGEFNLKMKQKLTHLKEVPSEAPT